MERRLKDFAFGFSRLTEIEILYRQGGLCDICDQPLPVDDTTFHHKVPRSDREHCTSKAENGVALHIWCHQAVEIYAQQGIPYDLIKGILRGGAI